MADLVLLGAGASAEAGVPTAFAMTRAIVDQFGSGRRRVDGAQLRSVLTYVCEELLASDSKPAESFGQLDVERVFSAVELLAERGRLEIAPFITEWRSGLADWDRFHARGENVFADLEASMLVELRRLVGTTQKRVSYLEPLVRFAADPARATIATLNYDRSIEGVGDAIGVPVHTGITSWVNTGRWDWPSSGVRLLKLHGSIDWAWEEDPSEDGHLPSRYIAQVAHPAHDPRPPAVVFGLRGKLRAEGPFLSALTEFESQLAGAPRLIVVGYSFRDDHVNQVIRRWTFENRSRRIVVVDPHLPRETPRRLVGMPFRDALLGYLINVEDGLGAETRLEVIRKPASRALEQLFREWTGSATRTRGGETGSRRHRATAGRHR
jgi:SIR2-like domain